ncbi:MAG: pyrimidine dimer DNA glycosylase/endonuclease V [Thermoplasmata archaeon]
MRLWSIHPKYLDRIGLLAVWREGLLAKKVLEGKTRGYRQHPQLIRFKNHKNPILAINAYLLEIYKEAKRREYNFDEHKIKTANMDEKIPVTSGQIAFELEHLLKKLIVRDTEKYGKIKRIKKEEIEVNSVFFVVPGEIEFWEKT